MEHNENDEKSVKNEATMKSAPRSKAKKAKKGKKSRKAKRKNKRPLSRFVIRHYQRCQSYNLERQKKVYYPSASSANVQGPPQKPEHTIKLKHDPIRKKDRKHIHHRKTFLTLCKFPELVEDARAAAILFLLVLLSQACYLLKKTALTLPVLVLDSSAFGSVHVLRTLLCAIQGPETWKGRDWNLKRPWVIQPQLSARETKPSVSIMDYIGGRFKNANFRKRKFVFPYIASAMLLLPDLPAAISKYFLTNSPLAMPIIFAPKGKTDSSRLIWELKDSMLNSYDKHGLKDMKRCTKDCYIETVTFLEWLSRKKKRIKRWEADIDRFRPVTHRGQFTQKGSDTQTELLCAALALFQQYLYYASEEKGWIKSGKAQKILLRYWRLVLPESAPPEKGSALNDSTLAYDTPAVFYRFLTERFIPTYHSQILQARKGSQGTMGLIRSFGNSAATTWFITPRSRFLEAYAAWLEETNNTPSFDPSNEAAIQRKLQDAGIPLRHEKGNHASWRYAFYEGKKEGAKKDDGENPPCFGLPLRELPEQVQTCFRDQFGITIPTADVPTRAEDVQNQSEAVKAL